MIEFFIICFFAGVLLLLTLWQLERTIKSKKILNKVLYEAAMSSDLREKIEEFLKRG